MKQYLVTDLHQQWLESGKQPVVLFSSSVPFESPEIIPVAFEAEPTPTLPAESVVTETLPRFEDTVPVEQPSVFVAVAPALELEPEPTPDPIDTLATAPELEALSPLPPQPPHWSVWLDALNHRLDTLPRWQLPKLRLPSFTLPRPTLPTLTLPSLSLPRLPERPAVPQLTAPELPKVTLPSFSWPKLPSLPALALPTATDFRHWLQTRTEPLRARVRTLPWPRILKIGSNLAYGAAIAVFAMFLVPIILLEGQSKLRQWQAQMAEVRLFSQTPTPPPTPTPTPEPEINTVDDFFSVEIPRLKIASRIIPNVSTSDAKQYESALKLGVAHAEGTGLPDDTSENKTIYLFAHSTNATFNIQRYNAQFYALKDTAVGDQIKVRYWGQDYWFTIQESKVVDANDTSYLQPQTEEVRLILQTCYPPGTTWKRWIVVATPTPKGEIPVAATE